MKREPEISNELRADLLELVGACEARIDDDLVTITEAAQHALEQLSAFDAARALLNSYGAEVAALPSRDRLLSMRRWLGSDWSDSRTAGPGATTRVDQIVQVLNGADGPMTSTEIIDGMQRAGHVDGVLGVRGTVTAALCRAVNQGVVERISRGLYQLPQDAVEAVRGG